MLICKFFQLYPKNVLQLICSKMDPVNDIWILCLRSLEQFSPLFKCHWYVEKTVRVVLQNASPSGIFLFLLWHHLTCSSMPFISYRLRVSFKDFNTFILNILIEKIAQELLLTSCLIISENIRCQSILLFYDSKSDHLFKVMMLNPSIVEESQPPCNYEDS